MTAIISCRRVRIFSACTALAFGALILSPGVAHAVEAAAAAPELVPTWKLKDLKGNEVSSGQFNGRVVVVDFWATWCGPCVGEIPGYIELQKKYGADGLVIVGISLDRNGPAPVQKFVEANGMNYLVVMGDDDVAEAFGGIEAIPTTFLIGRDGRIVHRKQGAMPHEAYEKLVQRALAP